jgi:hypothetical protein
MHWNRENDRNYTDLHLSGFSSVVENEYPFELRSLIQQKRNHIGFFVHQK